MIVRLYLIVNFYNFQNFPPLFILILFQMMLISYVILVTPSVIPLPYQQMFRGYEKHCLLVNLMLDSPVNLQYNSGDTFTVQSLAGS